MGDQVIIIKEQLVGIVSMEAIIILGVIIIVQEEQVGSLKLEATIITITTNIIIITMVVVCQVALETA